VVGSIEGISFVYFDDRDVVRHKLVQQIVKAYEVFSNGGAGRLPPARDPQGRADEARAAAPPRSDADRGEPAVPRPGSGRG
jgi:phosphate starvation-inducible PhoH-like protein